MWINYKTGNLKPYIEQTKSLSRYKARKKVHERENPESVFEFTIINLGSPGQDLNEKEQQALNALGGPTNKSRYGGTSNKKNVIKQKKNGSN